ncbi:hypothetical protein ES703_52894 [subsurface metagenome]
MLILSAKRPNRLYSADGVLGGNASCPCGSGLKYKNCCGASFFKVSPRNKPEVINSHLSSQNGGKTWHKMPGNLMAIIRVSKPEDSDKRIGSLISRVLDTSKALNNKTLENKLIVCRHKLHAVRYHLSTLKTEIKERVEDFEKNHSAGSGVAFELENPRLIYETEAFLFQVKSSLDLLTQALGCVIPPLMSMKTFKSKNIGGVNHAGGKVIYALKNNNAEELGDLFEQHRKKWIQELVKMRNDVTHFTNLQGFNCFIEEPYMGGKQVTVHYPTMPSGKKVDNYCQDVYEKLMELYESVLEFIPNSNL